MPVPPCLHAARARGQQWWVQRAGVVALAHEQERDESDDRCDANSAARTPEQRVPAREPERESEGADERKLVRKEGPRAEVARLGGVVVECELQRRPAMCNLPGQVGKHDQYGNEHSEPWPCGAQ